MSLTIPLTDLESHLWEAANRRKKRIETDLVECVLGLGPNLFYNSPMEAFLADDHIQHIVRTYD